MLSLGDSNSPFSSTDAEAEAWSTGAFVLIMLTTAPFGLSFAIACWRLSTSCPVPPTLAAGAPTRWLPSPAQPPPLRAPGPARHRREQAGRQAAPARRRHSRAHRSPARPAHRERVGRRRLRGRLSESACLSDGNEQTNDGE